MSVIHEAVITAIDRRFEDAVNETAAHKAIVASRYLVNPQFAASYDAISDLYNESEYGRHHATQIPRYMQRYPYSPSNNFFHAALDLGDDIHPVRHMNYTHDHIAVPFLKAELLQGRKLGAHAITLVRLASLTHDLGECTHPRLGETIGDNAYGSHTARSKQREMEIWDEVTEQTGIKGVLPMRMVPTLRRIVGDSEKSTVGALFETVERTGYWVTAAQAAHKAIMIDKKTERRDTLERLAVEVQAGHEEYIIDTGSPFPRQVVTELEPIFSALHHRLQRRNARLKVA